MKNAAVGQMQNLVKDVVVVNGRQVYVVVPDIAKFKTEAVAQLTKRPNKRRNDENRFAYLLGMFIRDYHMPKGKHMKIHLVAPVDFEAEAAKKKLAGAAKNSFMKKHAAEVGKTFVSEDDECITLALDELKAQAVPV